MEKGDLLRVIDRALERHSLNRECDRCVRNMAEMSRRAAAISIPGIILSQDASMTIPSNP